MLLSQALDAEPRLHAIRASLDRMLPDWRTPPPDDPEAIRLRVALGVVRP
jgi:hypothetical protein